MSVWRSILGFVVVVVIGHFVWPISEMLGEHAVVGWINHQIAERYGIVDPSQEQVIDFIVSWVGPALAVLIAYLIFRIGVWWGWRQSKSDSPTMIAVASEPKPNTTNPTKAPEADVNWRPIYRAIEHIGERIGDTNTADCLPDARLALRKAAHEKRIALQGRKEMPGSNGFRNRNSYSKVHTDIDSGYWSNSKINAYATSPDFQEDYHTEPETGLAWGPKGWDEKNHYANMRVNWADIIREWPINSLV